VETATTHSRRELEKKVADVRLRARVKRNVDPAQGDLLSPESGDGVAGAAVRTDNLLDEIPVRVSLEMTPEQFARYEALWEQLYKRGGVPAGKGKVELLLEAMAGLITTRDESAAWYQAGAPRGTGRKDPSREGRTPRGALGETSVGRKRFAKHTAAQRPASSPHFQIHVHRCPDCEQAAIQTSRVERSISQAELERALCDAQIQKPGQRNSSAIPPAVRREVLARDRHRCQAPGCENTHFLEIHHITPRHRGGGNQPENLRTLCSSCHRSWHERGSARQRATGTA